MPGLIHGLREHLINQTATLCILHCQYYCLFWRCDVIRQKTINWFIVRWEFVMLTFHIYTIMPLNFNKFRVSDDTLVVELGKI